MTVQEAKKIMEMFLHKQCDIYRTLFAYTDIEIWEAVKMSADALEEVEQYRALGTVEELKEAREKQIPMKIKEIHVDEYYCPACGAELNCNDSKVEDKYCRECGQRFEVGEEDD